MRPFSRLLPAIACLSCADGETPGGDTLRPGVVVTFPPAGCYRSATSVLGRTTPLAGRATVAPGWLRFDAPAGPDSGGVQLVDADGAAFRACQWTHDARQASCDGVPAIAS